MADELLAAIRGAIASETPNGGDNESITSAAPSGDADASGGTPPGDADAGDAAAGADGADAGAAGAGAAGAAGDADPDAGAGDGSVEGDGSEGTPRARDAQGRFVKADGSVDADQVAKKGEDGYVDPAAAAAAAKPKAADPVNDPIPEDAKPKTAERIRSLVATTKDLTTRVEQAESDRDLLVNQVSATGATPEQYVETLNILRDINSGDAAAEERAYEYLLKAATALGQRLGKSAPGEDPLTGHQDLIQEVIEGKVTRARAEEVAAARRSNAAQAQRNQVAQQANETRQEHAAAITNGTAALNQLEGKLKAADPTVFAAKRSTVIKIARPALAKLHPSQWASTFEAIYNATPVPRPAAPAPAAGKPGAPAHQPLRGKPAAGAQKAAPKSQEDAVRQSLGM